MDVGSGKSILVVFPVVTVLSTAGYLLWKDFNRIDEESIHAEVQEPIGTASFLSKNVKRKRAESPYWIPLNKEDLVYEGDTIRTGKGSFVSLDMDDSNVLEINENSLVKLEPNSGELEIDLQIGNLLAKGNKAPLNFQIGNNHLKSKGGEINLSKELDDEAKIIVSKGSAEFKDKNNKSYQINDSRILNIDKKGHATSSALAVILSSPRDKLELTDPRPQVEMPFTWTVLNPKVGPQIFELSSNKNFKGSDLIRKKVHQATRVPVSRGKHYWRVGWILNRKINYSEVRSISLKEDNRIQLTHPAKNSTFQLDPSDRSVYFSWRSDLESKTYVIEVSRKQDFKSLVLTSTAKKPELTTDRLQDGTYYWRVRAFDDKNTEIAKSSYSQFLIREQLPQVPRLLSPRLGSQWTLSDPLLYKWEKYDPANKYHITISETVGMDKIVKSESTEKENYLWRWTQPGTYYWQVEALKDAKVIGKSQISKVLVQPLDLRDSIKLVTPIHQSIINRDRVDPMDPIVFKWETSQEIKGPFTLVVSDTPDFSAAKQKRGLASLSHTVKMKEEGTYYWKIVAKGPKGEVESQVNAMRLNISSFLPPPALILPNTDEVFEVYDRESIEFEWEPVQGAEKYRLLVESLNKRTGERIPIIDGFTPATKFRSKPLEKGIYYWSVGSVDKGNVAGRLSPERQFNINVKDKLEAPKLNAPVVK